MKRLIASIAVALAVLMASLPGFTGMVEAGGNHGGGGGDRVTCNQSNTDLTLSVVNVSLLDLQANGIQSCNIVNINDNFNNITVKILTDNNAVVFAKAHKVLGIWAFYKKL